MLSKEVFKECIIKLNVFFPTWKVDITDATAMKLWYDQFKSYTDHNVKMAIDDFINKSTFNPTVKGIKEHITKNVYYGDEM